MNWIWYQTAMAGKDTSQLPLKDGDYFWCYAYDHEFKRAAIYPDAAGKPVATLDGKRTDPARLFASLVHRKKPGTMVTYAAWTDNLKNGTPWPAQAALERAEAERAGHVATEVAEAATDLPEAGVGHNSGATDLTADEELYQTIVELGRTFRAEQKRIELKPELRSAEETYTFMSGISAKALELFKSADGKRVIEKEPHLKACREVDGRWGRVTKLADELKKMAVTMTEPYLKWQAQEAAKAAKAAQENREAMTKAGVALPAMDTGRGRPKPAGAKLVTKQSIRFTDMPAFAAYLAGFKEPPPDFIAVLSTIALKLVANHVPDVPGVEIVTTQEARN